MDIITLLFRYPMIPFLLIIVSLPARFARVSLDEFGLAKHILLFLTSVRSLLGYILTSISGLVFGLETCYCLSLSTSPPYFQSRRVYSPPSKSTTMVSRIINIYKVLTTTFTNGYRDGVWRIAPIVPTNNTATEYRRPNSPARILPRSLIKRTEYGLNRLHRKDDMRRSRKHEQQIVIMASKTEYIQATRGMAKPPVRVDQLGIVPRWKKETLLGAEMFIKADTLEMAVYKKIYEACELAKKSTWA